MTINQGDIVVEMQHRHRLLIHDLKGIYALLKNNEFLSERQGWSLEKAKEQHERVIEIACERLEKMFDD